MEEASKEGRWPEPGDASLIVSFAARRRLSESDIFGGRFSNGIDRQFAVDELDSRLIAAADLNDFLSVSRQAFLGERHPDVLRRALDFMIPNTEESVESSFLNLFSALESALTFLRSEDAYEILPREQFSELERDLKRWLRQHHLLADESEKRALVYEKVRELNRFPFSYVFRKLCQSHQVYLDDLWPLLGPLREWPLLEIRHRLVHGDAFMARPAEALLCAREHLRWTAERMLLSVLGWSIERSGVSPKHLAGSSEMYRSWSRVRAQFA